MLYLLLEALRSWLIDHDLYRWFAVLDQLQFRALAAAGVAFFIVLVFGKPTIAWLVRQKIGDTGATDATALQATANQKANTPTMGGMLIVGAIAGSTILLANVGERYVQLGLIVVLWLALLGGFDDWLKLTAKRRGGGRQGLFAWEKMVFQLGLGLLVGIFLFLRPPSPDTPQDQLRMGLVLNLPGQKTYISSERLRPVVPSEVGGPGASQSPAPSELSIEAPSALGVRPKSDVQMVVNPAVLFLPPIIFIGVAMLMVAGLSNAVNITDGMDGLAGGISAAVMMGVFVLCLIAGDREAAEYLLVPHLPGTGELAVLVGATAGACLGFLWWNCWPAKVFMGDTGALALGGLVGYIAVAIRQEIVILLMCGVFIAEILSVVIQVGYFKSTGGKRFFKIAPYHHHLQQLGWPEQRVVARMWIVTIILVVVGLASVKIR
jgi:phospho-N-acetylmuramoyl-pentapeptide-transferase